MTPVIRKHNHMLNHNTLLNKNKNMLVKLKKATKPKNYHSITLKEIKKKNFRNKG